MTQRSLPTEAALIVNTSSRSGKDLFEAACEKLTAAGVKLREVHAVDDPDQLACTVRAAIANGTPMAIVGGGDGTLSGTIDELVGSDCVFAVLPLGTANSFARTLGLPLDLDGAVEVIAKGTRRRVDLGLINDDYFVNGASIGLPTMIGETVPHNLKRYLGRAGYFLWAIQCAIRFRAFQLIIDDDEARRQMWATEVRILNGNHQGGVQLSDNARASSGDIVIQAVVGRSRARLAADWYSKFFRLKARDAHSEEFCGSSFSIKTVPPLKVSIDGEVLARTPVTARVASGIIDVAVAI